jgi:uncharacterized protein
MRKQSIITGLAILGLCLAVAFPVCRGRFISWKLVKAVEENKVALVRSLLDKGISVNTKNSRGTPLLFISVDKGHRETTKLLLDNGADVDIKDDTRGFSFNHPLLKESGSFSYGGATALQVAAAKGDNDLVQLLIDNGADADISSNIIKSNAIMQRNKQAASVAMGGTAFHLALAVGQLETARLLLPRTNNVNTVCLKLTPLHYAVMHGQADIVKSLLEKGANVNVIGGDFNTTPLYLAISVSSDENCPDPEIAEQLLIFGADPDFENEHTIVPPLRIAFGNQCPELVKLLLDYGADVNMRTKRGLTLLQMAVVFGNTNMVELLLDYGADTDVVNNQGQTPLDMAVNRGCADIAEILRKHGAKTSAEIKQF